MKTTDLVAALRGLNLPQDHQHCANGLANTILAYYHPDTDLPLCVEPPAPAESANETPAPAPEVTDARPNGGDIYRFHRILSFLGVEPLLESREQAEGLRMMVAGRSAGQNEEKDKSESAIRRVCASRDVEIGVYAEANSILKARSAMQEAMLNNQSKVVDDLRARLAALESGDKPTAESPSGK
jgi:hypothetical protein